MVLDLERLADAQNIAGRLAGLPKDARLYIAGYADGSRSRAKRRKKPQESGNGEKEARP